MARTPWSPKCEFCGRSWGGDLTVAFSASLASRMYLSRTRLSQMRRGGAPRTGRPRGNSRKDSSSSGVQSGKESRAVGKVGSRGRGASLDRQVTPPAARPPVGPPHPYLGSAQALPPRSFSPAAACTPHPQLPASTSPGQTSVPV